MNNKQHLIKIVFDKNPDKLFTIKEISRNFGIDYFKTYYILRKIQGLKKFKYKNRIFFSKVNYNSF